MKAKLISNIIKLVIVAYVFYEYHHYQSALQNAPLSSDNAKALLYIAMAGFLILLPIDSSVFIKSFYNAKGHIDDSTKNIN